MTLTLILGVWMNLAQVMYLMPVDDTSCLAVYLHAGNYGYERGPTLDAPCALVAAEINKGAK